ncbi:hypothetical protein XENOCAPTIV_024486 [Xenoophorus captivus]|uniref:Clathrin/coatomer adaptor adaptin-like N-terminal domain-containing protein n=1 Tax=Xenoophorus captivus TaxID=1517983 RepID=A0ABV0RVJ6_9TELE
MKAKWSRRREWQGGMVQGQGYLFISVLVNSNSDLIRLINNAIKNDLASRNPTFMNLALHCIANGVVTAATSLITTLAQKSPDDFKTSVSLAEPPKSKKVQHSNAKNAVLFETITLIIHHDSEPNLLVRACNQLGQFLQHRETNLRYLALESMCTLASSEFSHEAVKTHIETVINALKPLDYRPQVLKVAILAEKYAVDYTWYVDTILNLIRIAGDYVSEEVWNYVCLTLMLKGNHRHCIVCLCSNQHKTVPLSFAHQCCACRTWCFCCACFFLSDRKCSSLPCEYPQALQAPACHENLVKVGGYILGEFGNLIAGDPRSSPMVQFNLLHSKFHLCSVPTRALLLSAYIKFINLFPEVKGTIQDVLRSDSQLRNADVELQQRAVEYLRLSCIASTDILATVLEEMPPFPERESSILAKLKKKKGSSKLPDMDDSRRTFNGSTEHNEDTEVANKVSHG